MSEVVIKVEHLYKEYRLGTIGYGTLRADFQSWWARIRGKEDPNSLISSTNKGSDKNELAEHFLALNDISFEIKKGEAVGIIGKNGAGKSTLLKILSKTTAPTSGIIKIKGRISSLLEVGTGFHPDLTGRENVFLNGAILGMKKKDIKKKFDEIVAFSGIEQFIDTPVKRYSSGMYVRLAFAVIAHLDSDILILDEVLAVGDTEFQKKCLGKMDDVAKNQGRTVILVSHNMESIRKFCEKCFLLKTGKLIYSGNSSETINKYIWDNVEKDKISQEWKNEDNVFDDPFFKPLRFALTDSLGKNIMMPVTNDSDFWITIECEIKKIDKELNFGYAIYSENGILLYWSYQTDAEYEKILFDEIGLLKIKSRIPKNLLNEGVFKIELISSIHYKYWITEPEKNAPCIYLTIKGGLSKSPFWIIKRPGELAPIIKWERLEK